jgi:hypothetical protein
MAAPPFFSLILPKKKKNNGIFRAIADFMSFPITGASSVNGSAEPCAP